MKQQEYLKHYHEMKLWIETSENEKLASFLKTQALESYDIDYSPIVVQERVIATDQPNYPLLKVRERHSHKTLLYTAIEKKNITATKLLLLYGANPYVKYFIV